MKCCFTTFSSKIFDFLYDIHLKRYIGLVVYGVEGCVALMKPPFEVKLNMRFIGGVRYIPQYILRIQKNIYGGIYFKNQCTCDTCLPALCIIDYTRLLRYIYSGIYQDIYKKSVYKTLVNLLSIYFVGIQYILFSVYITLIRLY